MKQKPNPHSLWSVVFDFANRCDAKTISQFADSRSWESGAVHRTITFKWSRREYGRAQFRRS